MMKFGKKKRKAKMNNSYHMFKLVGVDGHGFEYLEMRINADADLDTMLQTFECYLKAAGYSISGSLEIIDE
jgi:hypothetical protein